MAKEVFSLNKNKHTVCSILSLITLGNSISINYFCLILTYEGVETDVSNQEIKLSVKLVEFLLLGQL